MSEQVQPAPTRMSDPGAAALMTFGMALLYVFVVDVLNHHARGALLYGLLIAGVYQSIVSLLEHSRGDAYIGNLLGLFGIWLIGYFLLLNANPEKVATADAKGWYVLVLLVPVVLLALPAIKKKLVAIELAFLFLFFVILFLGLGFLQPTMTWLGPATGWAALCAAMPILYLAYERLMGAVG
ncbi:MAG: hypothetical protein V9G19_22430 [Tetrasphaera sp.]